MAQNVITGGDGSVGQTGEQVKTMINGNFSELYSGHLRGDWAGTTTLPITGGFGVGGLPTRGNRWRLTATLSIGGNVYAPGTIIEAAIDSPGQTVANWIFYAVQS